MNDKKRGCCGSTALAIVVARQSWREISLRKTQQMKNSLNFASTCLKVVDTRRGGAGRMVGNPSLTGLWKSWPLERSRPAADATRKANGAVYGDWLK